jgi:crotonobetainyl-CoA:carnitine CoA-transferase CaiB-like acyl-CoA transferase
VAGRFNYPRQLVSLTATPAAPARAPLLGEQNEEILRTLGISREEQQGLRATGII